MNIKFLAQGNNGLPLTEFEPTRQQSLDYLSGAFTTRARRHVLKGIKLYLIKYFYKIYQQLNFTGFIIIWLIPERVVT
jgi:hypothetical protein